MTSTHTTPMNIVLAGGGTMGSVTPLLAVAGELQARGHTLLFVGTQHGPEAPVVRGMNIPFVSIASAKIPRYVSAQWLTAPMRIALALWQSFWLLRREQPDVIVSAGGYVAVPLSWVAWWWFGIPSVIHQQDVVPTLSNRLIRVCAKTITTAFESSLNDFPPSPQRRVQWIGNPTRDLTPTTHTFQTIIEKELPTVLIMGGGTGASGMNALVSESLCETANIIHITGRGKKIAPLPHARYHQFEFLDEEIKEVFALATIVVSRAGMGSISEIAALQKPALFIPMPNSHQEQNGQAVADHNAGIIVAQDTLTQERFTQTINDLLLDVSRQKLLSRGMSALFPRGANAAFIEAIESSRKS